jgi:hypothetical protein
MLLDDSPVEDDPRAQIWYSDDVLCSHGFCYRRQCLDFIAFIRTEFSGCVAERTAYASIHLWEVQENMACRHKYLTVYLLRAENWYCTIERYQNNCFLQRDKRAEFVLKWSQNQWRQVTELRKMIGPGTPATYLTCWHGLQS